MYRRDAERIAGTKPLTLTVSCPSNQSPADLILESDVLIYDPEEGINAHITL